MLYEFQHFGLSEYFFCGSGRTPYANYPAHLHQSFEFITVLSGCVNISVDDKDYFLKENDSLLIFPNQIHSVEYKDCDFLLYLFSPDLVKAFSLKTANKLPVNNRFHLDSNTLELCKNLSEHDSSIRKKGLLYLICATFDEQTKYFDISYKDKNLLRTVFNFVENNYAKDCSLEKLSNETTYSYSYLSRYFKNTVGISFNSYVNQYRISKACYILTNSDCTILQCALDCGYNSLRSFNRNFISILSISPKAYRKRKGFTNEK